MSHPTLHRKSALSCAALVLAATLAACGGGSDDTPAPAPAPTPVPVGDTVALTASGRLVSFNRATPATLVGTVALSGLNSGESLLGIDVRPADGKLYALTSAGRIVTIDPSTGVATVKSSLQATAGDDNAFVMLTGAVYGVDFNPVADRMRVVSDAGQNLRINVDTGAVITDGVITPVSGTVRIGASAYTNSFAGTTTTQLFDVDAVTSLLHLQDPPNNGTLAAGLPLGVTGTGSDGFDIDARNNAGWLALGSGSGASTLYRVSLSTGAATLVDTVAGGEAIAGLALMQSAAPTALGLTTDNRLVSFDPKTPTTLTATTAITGLAAGELVLGIDTRPVDGVLYALTSSGRIVTLDPATGAATARTTLAADPADLTTPYTALAGTVFSVDFNPVADRLRVISDAGQNLRINVDTGATTTDGAINRAIAATVHAAAYSNTFVGTTATTLFNLEGASDVLTQQVPPNDGTLVNVGAFGVDISGLAGFDIGGGANGLALAALRPSGSGPYLLYSVALTTGAATLYRNTSGDATLSQIGGASGPALRDLAIRF